ncbi:hypothetical protein S40293_11541 [Stachybotrys chartarum IBT 40293]|nr:hypothetical protein S40293_11541 [Stachybotrys chartarum IBT 40293]
MSKDPKRGTEFLLTCFTSSLHGRRYAPSKGPHEADWKASSFSRVMILPYGGKEEYDAQELGTKDGGLSPRERKSKGGLSADLAMQGKDYIFEILQLADDNALEVQALDAYVFAFHGVFAVLTGMSGLTFFISLFIKQVSIDGDLLAEQKLPGSQGSKENVEA